MSDNKEAGSGSEEPVYTDIAYGIAKNMKTSEWELIKVAYNPITGEAKVKEKCHTGGYRIMAEEVFRITVAQELMI
jgi:hypothetical protein